MFNPNDRTNSRDRQISSSRQINFQQNPPKFAAHVFILEYKK